MKMKNTLNTVSMNPLSNFSAHSQKSLSVSCLFGYYDVEDVTRQKSMGARRPVGEGGLWALERVPGGIMRP